jgi:hypothetical protein
MDLPGEIRNRIYRLHLLVDEPIELLNKSSYGTYRSARKADECAQRRFEKIRTSQLKFLRLNKTVNKEASDFFYGENEFRFTAQEGWSYLRGFIHAIGDHNTARLRILTIHVPWPTLCYDRTDKACRIIPKTLEGPNRPEISTAQDYKDCVDILDRAGSLRQLKLVLPVSLEVEHVEDLRFDLSKYSEGLDITLIHLSIGCHHRDDANASQQPLTMSEPHRTRRRRRFITTRKNAVGVGSPPVYAESMGWKFEKAVVDEEGKYVYDSNDCHPSVCWLCA